MTTLPFLTPEEADVLRRAWGAFEQARRDVEVALKVALATRGQVAAEVTAITEAGLVIRGGDDG